jgi:hypothetical protein
MMVKPYLIRLLHCFRPQMKMGPEDKLAYEVASWCRAWTLDGSLRAIWWHTPNEGGGKLKAKAQVELGLKIALGMIPGAPDLVFIGNQHKRLFEGAVWRHCHDVVLIELKAGKNPQTLHQKDFEEWSAANGVRYLVCRSLAEVERALIEAGILAPTRRAP